MSITLSSMRTAVFTVRSSLAVSSLPLTMWFGRLIEPRLQTAISSLLVFKVISVHRFELWTTPTCCCGLRRLHGSLKVSHGWPVSNSMDSILRHRSLAWMVLNSLTLPGYSVRAS
ncbi:hypothetical protein D3C73_907350 [compost metagenome]